MPVVFYASLPFVLLPGTYCYSCSVYLFLSWSLWEHVSFEMEFHKDTMTGDDRKDSLKWYESVRMHICVYKCYPPNVFPDSGDKKQQSGQTTRSFKGSLTVLGMIY